jgi:hypothetical protein
MVFGNSGSNSILHTKGIGIGRGCELPPNGLAFSCRERATESVSKPNDLAREAVNCNGGLGHRSTSMEV